MDGLNHGTRGTIMPNHARCVRVHVHTMNLWAVKNTECWGNSHTDKPPAIANVIVDMGRPN